MLQQADMSHAAHPGQMARSDFFEYTKVLFA